MPRWKSGVSSLTNFRLATIGVDTDLDVEAPEELYTTDQGLLELCDFTTAYGASVLKPKAAPPLAVSVHKGMQAASQDAVGSRL